MNRIVGSRVQRYEFEAARLIGVDKSDVRKLRWLGRLDQQIVNALPKSSALQFNHARPLTDAVAANPNAVLTKADRLAGPKSRLPAEQVLELLVAAGSVGGPGRSHTPPAALPLSCDGQAVGRVKVARNGTVKIEQIAPRIPRPQRVGA